MPEPTDDERVDRLYGLPLEDFVRARDELARAIRDAGDTAGAKAVRALQKPSLPAWAVNQVARAEPGLVEELIAAGERLRAAQEAILAGGDRDELHAASAAERAVVGRLADRAEAFLSDAGHAPTADRRERIEASLLAAAGGGDARELLRAGRLTKDLQRVGFAGLDLAALAASPSRAEPGRREAAARDRERDERRRRAETIEQQAREAAAAADAARDRLEEAEAAVRKAREAYTRAQADADAARAEADDARVRADPDD